MFRGTRENDSGAEPTEVQETDTPVEDVAYYCHACERLITRARWVIRHEGAHEHRRFNPAGFVFRIRLFSEAPGVAVEDVETEDFSWFSGHAWSIATCGGCGLHLGWRFAQAGSVFFGLIRNRLVMRITSD
ncbi:MAG: hypothetical protein HOL85_03165 [Rhodospirillaceae bacterium]|jgi:hypothetical protein|nr:hypothetical protein [Rhodospirillaceae bacterium]MBT6138828.1 hypothetical protein [Rhodospirillaceae bacterium]